MPSHIYLRAAEPPRRVLQTVGKCSRGGHYESVVFYNLQVNPGG